MPADNSQLLKDPRILLLIAGVIISLLLIYPHPTQEGIKTNLKYGLELEGGSWLQLQLQGAIVEINADPAVIIQYEYQNYLNDPQLQIVKVKPDSIRFTTTKDVNTQQIEDLNFGPASLLKAEQVTTVAIKTTAEQVIRTYLQNHLDTEVKILQTKNGAAYEIRTSTNKTTLEQILKPVKGELVSYTEGVSQETRDDTKRILDAKLNAIGLKDIPIRTVGDNYILIDLAGVDIATARRIAATPGKFEIRIQTQNNQTTHVLYGDQISSVGIPQQQKNKAWGVPFRLTDEGAQALQEAAIKYGATTRPEAHKLIMYLDNKEIFSGPLSPELAANLQNIPVKDLVAQTGAGKEGEQEAKELQVHLRAGALPVNVNVIGSGQVPATLGEKFKEQLTTAGIITLIAVALIVYRRYKHREIIIPMLATTTSEVIMILGFAAAIQWQLDLPSITAIIAVIGTGIDHLIIITDEVLHQERGELPTEKIFKARISKAFGIIFAAAATTIAAMIPLTYMGFGALRGFAIVTIIGVLIGVLIARPAYGAIIKHTITNR
jgi:preprotein translocase subunit SecD